MKRFPVLRSLFCLVGMVGASCLLVSSGFAEEKDKAGLELFEKKIRPVLIQYCYECHSQDSKEIGGELLLDSRDGLLKGGDSGPAIVPGKIGKSLLINSLEHKDLEMPPEEKLPEDVIADFRRWVRIGAPDPRIDNSPSLENDPEADKKAQLWALKPVKEPSVPKVKATAWPRNDIDHFVLAEMEKRGLRPVADAKALVLLRRIYFDLIGLAPAPEEIERFSADASPKAFAELVDRLLESPQYGERWGRHWLDVARYAESNGKSRDVLMPYAWRYRDYVIDALSADIPYDQFLIEQLAGDLLPAESQEEQDRLIIATGFLALGSKAFSGGNLKLDTVDEQIEAIGKAMLGMTISCARCHDHKFDPIPTADYYAMAGIFLSTNTLYGGGLGGPKDPVGKLNVLHVLGDSEEQVSKIKAYGEKINKLTKEKAKLQKKLKQLRAKKKQGPPKGKNKKKIKLLLQAKPLNKDVAAEKKQPSQKDKKLQKENENKQKDEHPPAEEAKKKQDPAKAKAEEIAKLQQRRGEIDQEIKALKKDAPEEPGFAIGVRDAKKKADTRVRIHGVKDLMGELSPRGFLTAFEVPGASLIDSKQSGRLQLAHWVAHRNNPLTARIAVNRIWLHLFGRGIVNTVDNFGANSEPPTHPQLLDYLAQDFMVEGWSTKQLIRKIVLSHTYQLSSQLDKQNFSQDPGATYLWRINRRRLEAEALRDSMLQASGELDRQRPYASVVAQIGDGEVGRNLNIKPLSKPFPYRSVYLPIIRGIVPEPLKIFDFPEPSNVQGKRETTNVPAQSLYLMNNPFVIEQAEHLAQRLLDSSNDNVPRIQLAYQLCFSRLASLDEIERANQFLAKVLNEAPSEDPQVGSLKEEPASELEAWTLFSQAMFASTEFRLLSN